MNGPQTNHVFISILLYTTYNVLKAKVGAGIMQGERAAQEGGRDGMRVDERGSERRGQVRQHEEDDRHMHALVTSIGSFFLPHLCPGGLANSSQGGLQCKWLGDLAFCFPESQRANSGVCMIQMLFWMDMCGMMDSGGWEVDSCWLGKDNQHVIQEGRL